MNGSSHKLLKCAKTINSQFFRNNISHRIPLQCNFRKIEANAWFEAHYTMISYIVFQRIQYYSAFKKTIAFNEICYSDELIAFWSNTVLGVDQPTLLPLNQNVWWNDQKNRILQVLSWPRYNFSNPNFQKLDNMATASKLSIPMCPIQCFSK